MIPQETVSRILDTAEIVDVISDFVSLKRRGANYIACCPFHNEKTPSFSVSPTKGIYKCFGCGKSGTAVGFVMEHESLSYVEALKYLAGKYGIEIVEKEETAEDIAKKQRGESLLLVSEFAAGFFKENLNTPEGRSIGYAYFKYRGLEDGTIEKYGLGWAPKDRRALAEAASQKGFKEEFLIDTGLCVKYEDGKLSDRFFDRVIFPIHSVSGRVIAFGGRTLRADKTVAKYVNSPETEIYDKSRSLYGIYYAKSGISRSNKCYLVEGYLDVLSMHQLGITNVVASSGTSLTIQQIRMIRKFTDNITIMYDGDPAGIHAAVRGIGLVLKEGMNVKIVLIPDGDDPDSFAKKHSLEEVEAFIASSEQDFIDFKTDLLLKEAGNDPLKRAELINDIADTIALIPDAVKRAVYVQATGDKFNLPQDILFERIQKTREKIVLDDISAAKRESLRSGPSGFPQQADLETPELPDASIQAAAGLADESGKDVVRIFENRILEPSEKELLWFILNYGREVLMFPSDSPYYDSEEEVTVADFIRDAMYDNGEEHKFTNISYRKVYDSYFRLYDAGGLTQQAIEKALMDGDDRMVANVVADLTESNYRLSVSKLSASMTTLGYMLVRDVPRAILAYQSKRISSYLKDITEKLKNPDADAAELLRQFNAATETKKIIEKELGRLK